MQVLERIQAVRSRIEAAARRAGRDPEGIELVAVTKYAGFEPTREALASGLVSQIGESRVQDAERKIQALRAAGLSGFRVRLIGHLQRNKAGKAAALFDAVDTIDAYETAEALERRLEASDRRMPVLVQVNLGNPGQRGTAPEEAPGLVEALGKLSRVAPEGLMAIGPKDGSPEEIRRAFREAAGLRERIFGSRPSRLSLGMSRDFEIAVEEGADLIRVGSALFEDAP